MQLPKPLQNKPIVLAEEKLKDRLAAVAREKLTQANKEKQMQAERKRKAAMFINQLKSSGPLLGVDIPGILSNKNTTFLLKGSNTYRIFNELSFINKFIT